MAADTTVLVFNPKPTTAFSFSNRCVGLPSQFIDVSTSMPSGTVSSWNWHFDSDTTAFMNDTVSYNFTTPGSHSVILVVSNNYGCVDTLRRSIFMNPLPTAAFTHTSLCGDTVSFVQTSTVTPGSINSYTWSFGDNTFTVVPNPVHVYPDTNSYVVTLLVRSDSMCTNVITDTVKPRVCVNDVIVLIGDPAVPTGFTPNGDGYNDNLFVKGGPFTSLEFRVFNEWGNLIFYSTDQSVGWDGKYKGAPQAVGRYIWTVSGEVINGKQFKMAGEVILNR